MPNMASFLTEELPDNDNYRILINYKFWSSLMSYVNINEWTLHTNICSFVISREKSEKNYKIGLVVNRYVYECQLAWYKMGLDLKFAAILGVYNLVLCDCGTFHREQFANKVNCMDRA